MKVVNLEHAVLDSCVEDAQSERVIITRDGKPVAIILGIEGLDEDQLKLVGSDKFWKFIEERRKQKTFSRAELEERINNSS